MTVLLLIKMGVLEEHGHDYSKGASASMHIHIYIHTQNLDYSTVLSALAV